MKHSNRKSDDMVIKLKPTIFPLGFTVSQVEKSLVIVDFIDIISGKPTVLESIALPIEKAHQLSSALTEALKNDSSED
ncbi:MAG: hypothetical protein ABTR54_07930 [Candidatus Competibacter sp.]